MAETITYKTLAGETDTLDRDAAEVVDATYISPFGLSEIVRTASGQLIRVYEPEGNDHLRNPPEPEARELMTAEAVQWMQRHGREVPEWLKERAEQRERNQSGEIATDESTDLQTRALQIYLQNPELTNRQIAEKLGCHPKSLSKRRCPRLHAAREASRQSRNLPRGSKTEDSGIDAWE